MWRILLVDDDRKYRRLLGGNLERLGHEVIEAGEGGPALELAQLDQPHVVLLDFNLPDMSGADVCRGLKANPRTSSIPVAILTGRADEETRVAGFEAGADDYVVKPFSFRELVLRLRVLVERVASTAGGVVSLGSLMLDFDTHRVRVNGVLKDVSRTELAVLRSLSEQPGRVWTREALLDSVWGLEADVDSRVVDGLVRRLREKLGNAAGYLQTVRGVGYRLDTPADV